MSYGHVVEALESHNCVSHGNDWTCPCHKAGAEKSPSLSVNVGDKGAVLLHCHAGCSTDDVLASLQLAKSDLYENPIQRSELSPDETWMPGNKKAVAVYQYIDEESRLLYRISRSADKSFAVSAPDSTKPHGWRWKKDGLRLVIYNLPAVLAARESGRQVFLVEGEKDADALIAAGEVATCHAFGAKNWNDEYAKFFEDLDMCIVVDKDEAGAIWAENASRALVGVAKSVIFLEAAEGKDSYDHLAAGYGVEDFLIKDLDATEKDSLKDELPRASLGGQFLFETTTNAKPIWGKDDQALWQPGESLIIAGGPGLGKTTLGQQVVLGLLGLRDEVLGYPVQQARAKVLYIAADRPEQFKRSFLRMVTRNDKDLLNDRLICHRGPIPFNIVKEPLALAEKCQKLEVSTVVIDSLKDIAPDLSKDETGSGVNISIQNALAEGIDVMILHHQRKVQQGASKDRTLDAVYGSTWITSGAGSVILLVGEAGDPIVELVHVKQPADAVGPFQIFHDHETGTTRVEERVDLLELVRHTQRGVTPMLAAVKLFNTIDPKRNDIEKARRKLEALVSQSFIRKEVTEISGPSGGRPETVYYPLRASDL